MVKEKSEEEGRRGCTAGGEEEEGERRVLRCSRWCRQREEKRESVIAVRRKRGRAVMKLPWTAAAPDGAVGAVNAREKERKRGRGAAGAATAPGSCVQHLGEVSLQQVNLHPREFYGLPSCVSLCGKKAGNEDLWDV